MAQRSAESTRSASGIYPQFACLPIVSQVTLLEPAPLRAASPGFLEVLATGHGLPTPLRIDPAASDVRRFDTPLVDLLNVRWVISDHAPASDYVERFRPRPGSHGAAVKHDELLSDRVRDRCATPDDHRVVGRSVKSF